MYLFKIISVLFFLWNGILPATIRVILQWELCSYPLNVPLDCKRMQLCVSYNKFYLYFEIKWLMILSWKIVVFLFVVKDEVFFILLKVIQPLNCVGGWGAAALMSCQDWFFWVWNFCHHVMKFWGCCIGVVEVCFLWFGTASWGDGMTLLLSVKP